MFTALVDTLVNPRENNKSENISLQTSALVEVQTKTKVHPVCNVCSQMIDCAMSSVDPKYLLEEKDASYCEPWVELLSVIFSKSFPGSLE